jgi:TetR/AcrR family transcriptional repressor of uid operon
MAPAETLTLLSRALDPAVEPPDDAISERVLDAALALAAASGIQHLTMDEIAARAGVGRMTVYRRFGDKDRLLDALAVREARRCLAELDAVSDPAAAVADQVAAGLATSLRLARAHPLLNRLARVEPESVLAALTANGGALFAMSRAFVAQRLRESQRAGVLEADVEVEAAAEMLVRLAFSFVLIQETALPLDDEERVRAIARELVAPILGA